MRRRGQLDTLLHAAAAHNRGMTVLSNSAKPRDLRGRYTEYARTEAAGFDLTPPSALEVEHAADPNNSAAELTHLSYSKNPRVREAVIDNPSTPAEVLRRYLDLGIHQRSRILRSPALTVEDLHDIATRRDRRNNAIIAALDTITDDTMAECAATDIISATTIAGRPDAPAWLLARLARDHRSRQVLQALIANPRSPQAVRAIAASRDAEIHANLEQV